MTKKWILIAVIAALFGGVAYTSSEDCASWLTGTTDEKLDTLACIQPGLGTVMIEYGNRMGNMYYAAQAGNWGMAAYQLKEAVEIQEVGETTRPSKAPLLINFEETSLKPLAQSIVDQDWDSFQMHFDVMVNACNACHVATGHRYIVYQLPNQPLVPAKLDTGQTFTREELAQILSDLLE